MERIKLGRSEAFTLWTNGAAAAVEPVEKATNGSVSAAAIPGIPSQAFTLWTCGADSPAAVGESGAAGSAAIASPPSKAFSLWIGGESSGVAVVSPLPEEVFDDAGADLPRPARSRAFTLWASAEALAKSPAVAVRDADEVALVPIRENNAFTLWTKPAATAEAPAIDTEGSAPAPGVAEVFGLPGGSKAFTLWAVQSLEAVAAPVADTAAVEDDGAVQPWQGSAERQPKTGIGALVALAVALVLLLVALFVIAEKNKDIGKMKGKIRALNGDLKEMKSENIVLEAKLAGERTKVVRLDSQLEATRAVGEELTTQRDDVRKLLAAAKKSHAEKVAALEGELGNSAKALVAAETRIVVDSKERALLEKAISIAEIKIKEQDAAMAKAATVHAEAVEVAKVESAALTKKITAAAAKASQLEASMVAGKKAADSLRKENADLKAKIADLEKAAKPAPDPVPEPEPDAPETPATPDPPAEPKPGEGEKEEPKVEPEPKPDPKKDGPIRV